MFERFKSRPATNGTSGGTAVADPPAEDTRTADDGTTTARRRQAARPLATREHLDVARARQREEYGGVNWGASFFGWLVAVGLGSLLVAVLAATGAAIGLTEIQNQANNASEETLGLGGAIALLVVLMIAYYCGGYVAGRMSRFDGTRQGLGAWLIGVVVAIILAVAGVIFGQQYNVLQQLNLPSLPTGNASFASGGAIALVLVLVGTLLAAAVGGKAGERYHRKIDRAGFID
jgi:uncharacterized membrane protein